MVSFDKKMQGNLWTCQHGFLFIGERGVNTYWKLFTFYNIMSLQNTHSDQILFILLLRWNSETVFYII